MDVMESIIEKHADDEVLQSVAEVITYFTTNVAVRFFVLFYEAFFFFENQFVCY